MTVDINSQSRHRTLQLLGVETRTVPRDGDGDGFYSPRKGMPDRTPMPVPVAVKTPEAKKAKKPRNDTYFRVQSADRDPAELLDPNHVSYSWDNPDVFDRGTSTARTLGELAEYLAQTGIPIGLGDWVIVEVAGEDLGPGRDHLLKERLVQVDEIVSVRPLDDEFFDMVGAAYDRIEAQGHARMSSARGERGVNVDVLTRDRVLRLAGVELRGHPHPGQHYKHGWLPVAGVPVELLTPGDADRDYGDELDRVEFGNGDAVVARSEGTLTIETDAGGHTQIHAAPSPAEAESWADYIDDGLDLDEGETTHLDDLTVLRTADGLSLRWPHGDEDADPEELDGVDLAEADVPGFTQALRDMAYITEDNKTVPDEEDEDESGPADEPDAAMMRHRQLQLLGVEVRAFDTAKHPHYKAGVAKGKGGQFRPIAQQIMDALLGNGDGDGDRLAGFSQPQLKKAAEQLGLNPPKGMRLVPLKGLLMAHARGGKGVDVPEAKPSTAHPGDKRMRDAFEAARNPGIQWAGLSALREELAARGLGRKAQDDELMRMLSEGKIRLIPEENQKTITQSDKSAAINISGEDKHLIGFVDEMSPKPAAKAHTTAELDHTLRHSTNPAELKAAAEEWKQRTGGKDHTWVRAYGDDYARMAKDNKATTQTLNAEAVAGRLNQMDSEDKIVQALQGMSAPDLRRVGKESSIGFPSGMKDPEAMRAHIARSFMAYGSAGTPKPAAKKAAKAPGKAEPNSHPDLRPDGSGNPAKVRETLTGMDPDHRQAYLDDLTAGMNQTKIRALAKDLGVKNAGRSTREQAVGLILDHFSPTRKKTISQAMAGNDEPLMGSHEWFKQHGGQHPSSAKATGLAKSTPKVAKPDPAKVSADFAEAVKRPMPSDRERFKKELGALTGTQLAEVALSHGVKLPAGRKQDKADWLVEARIGYQLDSEAIRHGGWQHDVGGENARGRELLRISNLMHEADLRGDRAEYGRLHQERLNVDKTIGLNFPAKPQQPSKVGAPAPTAPTPPAGIVGGASGPEIQVAASTKDLTTEQLMRGEHLTAAGRAALDALGPTGHPRLAAIASPEGKLREAYRMLAIPGGGNDHWVALTDVRKLIGDQVSRAELDATLKNMAIHMPDAHLAPQAYARGNAETRIPAAVIMGGQEMDQLHIDDPSLSRPEQFGALAMADELDNRRSGRQTDPLMALLTDMELQAEIDRRVANDPIVARDLAARMAAALKAMGPPTQQRSMDPQQRDRVLALATRAAGQDATPGHDQLHHYWTRDPEGLAKWRTSPHPWTTLRDHLLKYVSPHKAVLMASKWFEEVFGYTAGSDLHRLDSGLPPRGHLVGPG